jgi:adenylate cyclase
MVIVADQCRRNWNTALRYLNLSGNKRLEIKPTSAQDMSHASSFRKELSDFTALTQLRVLGLMDVTLRIPSLPDESDEKRVRTSFSDINNMAYGISDMLGSIEHLAMFDLVVPNFRGKDNECLFGMFGRPAPSVPSGKVPKFLQESFSNMLSSQLERLSPEEDVTQALRRTFLYSNRKTFEFLTNSAKERKRSVASFQSMDSMFRNWHPGAGSQFRTGAAGAVVYLVDHTLHVANVGDTLVVISRKGEAELLSKLHDPTDREETARIRRAEARGHLERVWLLAAFPSDQRLARGADPSDRRVGRVCHHREPRAVEMLLVPDRGGHRPDGA